MRRRDRYILNAALVTGAAALGINIFRQWLRKKETGERLTWDNFDGKNALKTTALWMGIGGFGGYLLYEYKISEESKLPFNSDEHLKKILTEEHLKNNPRSFNAMLQHRKKVKQWLAETFGCKLVAFPQDTGSFAKRTAIASNYDLDIILPFKKNSYRSLEEMYYNVYETVRKAYGGKATVTKQTKAIGITFEHGGEEIYFDIVPGRETAKFKNDTNINLYVRPDWVWQRGSSFKTNFASQRYITVNKPEARQIIKLLKAYRDRNDFELPTVVIEQCVVSAMSENNFGVHASVTENLLNSMDHIAKRLNQVTLPDVANSNNNLNAKLNNGQKNYLINQLYNDIQRIEQNSRYIKEVFTQ